MRVAIVGGTGRIGRAVAAALEGHELVVIGRSSPIRADLSDLASIREMYARLGPVDAVVLTAGRAAFGTLPELTDDQVSDTLADLAGRFAVVRYGLENVVDGGSFTLTAGDLSIHPFAGSALVTPVGAAVEAFARSAALSLPRSIRINVVSPPLVAMGDGDEGTPVDVVAGWFVESVMGERTGQVRFGTGWV